MLYNDFKLSFNIPKNKVTESILVKHTHTGTMTTTCQVLFSSYNMPEGSLIPEVLQNKLRHSIYIYSRQLLRNTSQQLFLNTSAAGYEQDMDFV
jgi:hypothetical protein